MAIHATRRGTIGGPADPYPPGRARYKRCRIHLGATTAIWTDTSSQSLCPRMSTRHLASLGVLPGVFPGASPVDWLIHRDGRRSGVRATTGSSHFFGLGSDEANF